MPGVEVLPDGRRRVTLWKRAGIDMDRYASADDKPADSHKNSSERTNAMRSAELQKMAEAHERRFGPLGAATANGRIGGESAMLLKCDEIQKSDPSMSSAEAMRRAMKDPTIRASYEREFDRAQGAAPAVVGLSKCEAVAAELCKSNPRMSAAEGFRQAMGTPAIRDAYARETGYVGPGAFAKAEADRGLDEQAVEKRAEQLEREGQPWREAWAQAIREAGFGGGARAAA